MTNDRIQKWLASVTRHEANRALINELPGSLVVEAAEIIRFLAGPDGALGIADVAAVELIVSECPWHEDGGLSYLEVTPHPVRNGTGHGRRRDCPRGRPGRALPCSARPARTPPLQRALGAPPRGDLI